MYFSCNCSYSNYKIFLDSDHGHITTGNSNIVSNLKLRKLAAYGTKFRLPAILLIYQTNNATTYI